MLATPNGPYADVIIYLFLELIEGNSSSPVPTLEGMVIALEF